MARWLHPRVILVASDLTDLDRLMPFAQQQASETGARLILIHVVSTSASMAADAAGMPYYDPSGALEFATKGLQPWCMHARERGMSCETLVREGNAAQQIGAASRQFRADRLILGTRSRSKLGKLLLGSVAEQVLRSVNVPAVTIGPQAHAEVAVGSERVMLHATLLRETARAGAMVAGQIAASQGARLVLLHVLQSTGRFLSDEPGRDGQPAGLDSAALHQLQFLATESRTASGADVEAHVVHGSPAIEILAEATKLRANLIVLGARNHSMFEELTRDRTVCRVLAHARCPVLTLREAPQAAIMSAVLQESARS